MKPLLPSLLVLGAAAAFTSALPVPPEVTIAFDQAVYLPGEPAYLTVTGPPGTLVWLGFDFDSGPTALPGIGVVDLGFSEAFNFAFLSPIPESGSMTLVWDCDHLCHHPMLGNDLFVQGVVLDPVTMEFGVTNSTVLNVEDVYGFCESEGCTPGFWKNKPQEWKETGLKPNDSWNDTFGVEGFDPDVTLMDALDPTTELQTFGAHAVAALLNALHPDFEYSLSPEEVITLVQDAVNSGSWPQMLEVKDILAHLNESGCPL